MAKPTHLPRDSGMDPEQGSDEGRRRKEMRVREEGREVTDQ